MSDEESYFEETVEEGGEEDHNKDEEYDEEYDDDNIIGESPSSLPIDHRAKKRKTFLKEKPLTEEELVKKRIEETRENLSIMLGNLSEKQMHRYETFRRVGLPRSSVKKVVANALSSSGGGTNVLIALSGVGKLFVGELVEEALLVAKSWTPQDYGEKDGNKEDESKPLLPSHLREALRRMKLSGRFPNSSLYRHPSLHGFDY